MSEFAAGAGAGPPAGRGALAGPDVFDRIRRACAEVARRARSVRIDGAALARLAAVLEREPAPGAELDPGLRPLADEASTLAFVISLDAVNFGSGWFPELRKRRGLSGYRSIATALRERFERAGAPGAGELARVSAEDCAELFGQQGVAPVAELMALFARALSDLGRFLLSRFGGDFAALVAAAGGSPGRMLELLCEMPLYRDVARYDELEVPFYKRAQITVSDLATVFGGRGAGAFRELERLTLFADNLVPHVLRCEGVLVAEPALAQRIEASELLAAGSPEEVELRACAVHAVEGLVAELRARGVVTSAARLDSRLWGRGQRPEFKARPRHRTRCAFY